VTPIKVLITDDHFIVREGLQLILETVEDITVIGEAANGQEALDLAISLAPDVILMDMQMPVMDGLTAIRRLGEVAPHIAILILTTYNEDRLMLEGLQAGAKGFLLKDVSRDRLIQAIYAAARGETLLTADMMTRLLNFTTAPSPKPENASVARLTERELEVLRGVAEGQTNKGISLRLNITERTVKAHLESVFEKLGVNSRAAAISAALQRGLLG
jgi:NarL family two-component system response regulator YdfI